MNPFLIIITLLITIIIYYFIQFLRHSFYYRPQKIIKPKKSFSFIKNFLTPGKFLSFFINKKRIKNNIEYAGSEFKLNFKKILRLKKLIFILFFIILDLELIFYGFSRPNKIFWILILVCLLFYLPDLWLKQIVEKKRKLLNRELPNLIDLLALNIESGLNLRKSLEHLEIKYQGYFRQDIIKINKELRLGRSLEDCLKEWKNKIKLDDFNYFISNILQALYLGTPLTIILQSQSERLRIKRRQIAEELSHTAAVKITIPLVFLIFPALLILYLAPALIRFFQETNF